MGNQKYPQTGRAHQQALTDKEGRAVSATVQLRAVRFTGRQEWAGNAFENASRRAAVAPLAA